MLLQLRDARLRLLLAHPTLKHEGARDDSDGQGADLTRTGGDDGSGSRTRAAAHAGGHEDHVGALQRLQDVVAALFRRLFSDLGTRTRAQAARELLADLDAFRRHRMQERLRIRIDGDELHTLKPCCNHAVHGVPAAAAHANDLDLGELVQTCIIQFKHDSNPQNIA